METISTVTPKGQITIPISVRKVMGVKPGSRIQFAVDKKTKLTTMKRLLDLDELMGFFKTNKKYDKKKAEQAYVKDIVKDYLAKLKRSE